MKVLFKLALLGLPLLAIFATLLGSYAYYDPFCVLYVYDNYYVREEVGLNRDFVSTEVYLKNRKIYKYDSYIFGSSRSWAFPAAQWKHKIDSQAAFHFDAYNENLFGIAGKLELIDASGDPIRNVLIVVERDLLAGDEEDTGHLFAKHPAVSKKSWAGFQATFLHAYCTPSFFVPYLYRKASGKAAPWFDSPFQNHGLDQDTATNDLRMTRRERQIAADPADYFRPANFPRPSISPGSDVIHAPVIGELQKRLLEQIQAILNKHTTNVQIVIGPMFDQKRLHGDDVAVLRRIFGNDRVHDYSGVNRFTKDIHNYYETSHYRVLVGQQILDEIYPGH